MKKNLTNLVVIGIILIICYETLTHSSSVISSIKDSYNIWVSNVFPSLFPIITLSRILIDLDFPIMLGKITKPIMNKLFNLNSNTAFILIMSMLSGSPSNAAFAKELYLNGSINEIEASKTLLFSHFSSPLFILGSISSFLNNKKVGLFILVIHYLTNILIAFLSRKYNTSNKEANITTNNKKNISSSITNSIKYSVNTCLMILGVICISTLLITVISENFKLNDSINTIFAGLIEMTNGIKMLSNIDISLKLKTTLSMLFISFGGLSIHLQIISIINDTKIKYRNFLIGRIMHAFISTIFAYILFDLFI